MIKKFLIGTFALALMLSASAALASYDFGTTTLRVGSKGDYVKTLQTLVGATPVDGNFGPMTAAKVKVWQAANGLTADGVFGPMSMAKANLGLGGTTTGTLPAGCTAGALFSATTGAPCTPGTTPTTPTTITGDGDVFDFEIKAEDDALASSDDQHVATIEFEVEDGDVVLQKVDLYFEEATVANDLWDNVKSVKLVSDGKTIAEVDVSDDSDWKDHGDSANVGDDVYSVALSNKTVFKDGDKAELEVMLETTDEVDTATSEDYNLWAELRFVNAEGVLIYLGEDESNDTDAIAFSIEEIGNFELSFDENSNSPDTDETLDLSSSTTETLVIVDAEVGEEQGGTLESAEVEVTITLAAAAVAAQDTDDLVSKLMFFVDGKEVDTDDASVEIAIGDTDGTLTFDIDLDDMDVEAEDELKFEVKAMFEDIEDDSEFVGATVQATEITIKGEDSLGDNFTPEVEDTSYSPVYTVTAGAIDITWTEEPEALEGATENAGTIVFTVRVENETGSDLLNLDNAANWAFDATGYSLTGVPTIKDGDGDALVAGFDLLDGDDQEFEITLSYNAKSTKAFTVEIEEVGGVPVSSVWKD